MKRKLLESEKKIVASSQSWTCQKCKTLLPSSYEIDHIIPHCISLNDNRDNLAALCPTCHACKTQRENSRIIKFKKLKAIKKLNLCWFCLEKHEHSHVCEKVLKKIVFYENEDIPSLIKSFDQFYYTEDSTEDIEKSMQKLKIDTTLHVELAAGHIYVQNFFTSSEKFTLKEIAKAIFIGTRTKRDSKKYTEIEFTIGSDISDETELVNNIDGNLHNMLTQRIFAPNDSIQYTYIMS